MVGHLSDPAATSPGFAGDRREMVQVPITKLSSFARLLQPVDGVLPNHLEHPVADRGSALSRQHQRLVDQRGEQVEQRVAVNLTAGAHLLRRIERESTREYPQPPEQHPLLVGQQVVTPVD